MKKKIAFLLAIAMLTVSLAACGSEKKENDKSNLNSNISSSAGDVSEDTSSSSSTPDKSDGATSSTPITDDNIANTPAQSTETTQPEQNQTAQQPTTKPQEKPVTPPANNNNNNTQTKPQQPSNPAPQPTPETPAKSPAVSDIAAAIDKALGVDANFMSFTADDVAVNYGSGSSSMAECVGKKPMMSVKATEYHVVKAADGQVDAVKNGMIKRQADLDAQWKQYLPEQYELVKNYKLVANGNYVLFVIGDNADGAVETFNSMTK